MFTQKAQSRVHSEFPRLVHDNTWQLTPLTPPRADARSMFYMPREARKFNSIAMMLEGAVGGRHEIRIGPSAGMEKGGLANNGRAGGLAWLSLTTGPFKASVSSHLLTSSLLSSFPTPFPLSMGIILMPAPCVHHIRVKAFNLHKWY